MNEMVYSHSTPGASSRLEFEFPALYNRIVVLSLGVYDVSRNQPPSLITCIHPLEEGRAWSPFSLNKPSHTILAAYRHSMNTDLKMIEL